MPGKSRGVDDRSCRLSNIRTRATWELLGIRTAQEPPFQFCAFPCFWEARCQFLISQIISLAIKEELSTYTEDISIKWPNDIYWKEKKICGILIENDLMGRNICQSIAGIGININQEEFYSPAPNPVSLYQITGKRHDVFEILKNIMIRVQSYYAKLQKEI